MNKQTRKFDKTDFTTATWEQDEYEHCVYVNCDFSNVDLSGSVFADCEFINCNLSLIKLKKTSLRDVQFKGCKMLGVRFYECNMFALSFCLDNCILSHSSFYRLKLPKFRISNSTLTEVDFTECDLGNAVLDNCDLSGAVFDHTILEKADLRTSYNYSIDPETNRVKKAKFSLSGISGLLDKYDIEIEH